MDRGAWRATVHEVAQSQTTEHTHKHTHKISIIFKYFYIYTSTKYHIYTSLFCSPFKYLLHFKNWGNIVP